MVTFYGACLEEYSNLTLKQTNILNSQLLYADRFSIEYFVLFINYFGKLTLTFSNNTTMYITSLTICIYYYFQYVLLLLFVE